VIIWGTSINEPQFQRQNDVCIYLSSQLGIEPPYRHALAQSFENRIKVVLDIWAFQYAKQWPAHKAAFGKGPFV
jgi:hypothetical protein